MIRIVTLTLFLTFITIFSFSQKEANIWYFGQNSGLSFNTNPATVLTDGKINTREGVAVISDKSSGQLLFYTEGTMVWNRNHVLMSNGSGLQGDYSSTQSAVIVPNPANINRYYIFTTAINQGFRYSEVDMSLNGGLGDVLVPTKNRLLVSPGVSTEKVIATRHCNGRDYWVITHTANDNNYLVYLISAAGVAPLPLVFSIGMTLRKTAGDYELTGYLKLSPDASQLANAIGTNMDMSSSPVELLNFNNATGAITGPVIQLSNLASPYGIEFSQNAKLIYVTEIIGKRVNQYDLTAANVNGSKVTLASSGSLSYGALQLGPDGRIYVAAENGYTIPYGFLSTINFPNIAGAACGYQANSVSLGSTATLIGLPTFISSYLKDTSGFTYQGTCANANINFNLTYSGNVDSVKWDFGDNTARSTAFTPAHSYSGNGAYNVQLIIYRRCDVNDTVSKVINTSQKYNVAEARSICPGSSYTLPDGTVVTRSGVYPVTLRSVNGCDSVVTTTVNYSALPDVNIGKDTSLCSGSSVLLSAGTGYSSYKWQDGSKNSSITVKTAGVYWVEVQSATNGCFNRDSINITVGNNFSFSLGPDTSVCSNRSIRIGKTVANAISYLWNTGAVVPQIDVNASATYWLEIKVSDGCTGRDSIDIKSNPAPVFSLGKDTSLCNSQSITVGRSVVNAHSYIWNTGAITPSITTSATGLYWQDVTNNFECSNRDTININPLPSVSFNLGKDTTICYQQFIALGAPIAGAVSYLWNTGSTASQISTNAAGTYWLEVQNNSGCKSRDSIIVSASTVGNFTLGKDPSICNGQTTTLSAFTNGATYLWSNGSNGPQLAVNAPGIYWAEISVQGCRQRDSVSVTEHANPVVIAYSSNDINCAVAASQLSATGASNYVWTPAVGISNASVANPIVRTNSTTTYYVKGTDSSGCVGNDSVTVKVTGEGNSSFNLPNAFTPNGDGKNDCFGIVKGGLIDLEEFAVFNRWGDKVFTTKDPSRCWDGTYKGKMQDPGGFVYIIKANSICGTIFKKGIVMLIR